VWTAKNQYYITGYDIQQHFPDDTLRVERFVADRVYALCYYDGEQNYYYMKRFQLEVSDKTQYFLDEGSPMRFVTITYRKGSTLEVVFGGQHSQRPTEMVDVDEFIGIKSHRAKGKRITTYEVDTLRFIEPEEPEVEEDIEELEPMDVVDGGQDDIDVEELVGEGIEVVPGTDYDSREEGDDVGFTAEQLDLF
jgi:topoisomerase-4 subunit A